MQKKTHGTVSFGGPTVLTVLIVLCFACFSLLALSRASADYRLTVRSAQTVSDYFAAEGSVQTVLGQWDVQSGELPEQAGERLLELAAQNGVQASLSEDGALVTLCADAGSQGVLTTQVRLYAAEERLDWTIQSSCVIPDDPEQTDSTLPVYQ